jgi:hypothetical protein
MKAPIAQAAAEAASALGCAFLFSWGLIVVNFILRNLDFGWVQI